MGWERVSAYLVESFMLVIIQDYVTRCTVLPLLTFDCCHVSTIHVANACLRWLSLLLATLDRCVADSKIIAKLAG